VRGRCRKSPLAGTTAPFRLTPGDRATGSRPAAVVAGGSIHGAPAREGAVVRTPLDGDPGDGIIKPLIYVGLAGFATW
jgi:hypothetical protein